MTVITEGWLTEMLGMCQRREVGAVGVKLLYPDDTIQHAGCVIGIGGIAGHMFVNMPANRTGYLHKASILQDMSAVTAACMMMKKAAFEEVGGFTEELSVAFNDVDLCLKVRETGRLIVYDHMYSCIIWNQKHEVQKTARRRYGVSGRNRVYPVSLDRYSEKRRSVL